MPFDERHRSREGHDGVDAAVHDERRHPGPGPRIPHPRQGSRVDRLDEAECPRTEPAAEHAHRRRRDRARQVGVRHGVVDDPRPVERRGHEGQSHDRLAMRRVLEREHRDRAAHRPRHQHDLAGPAREGVGDRVVDVAPLARAQRGGQGIGGGALLVAGVRHHERHPSGIHRRRRRSQCSVAAGPQPVHVDRPAPVGRVGLADLPRLGDPAAPQRHGDVPRGPDVFGGADALRGPGRHGDAVGESVRARRELAHDPVLLDAERFADHHVPTVVEPQAVGARLAALERGGHGDRVARDGHGAVDLRRARGDEPTGDVAGERGVGEGDGGDDDSGAEGEGRIMGGLPWVGG